MQCTLKQDLAIKAEKKRSAGLYKNKKRKNKTTAQPRVPGAVCICGRCAVVFEYL